MANGNVAGKKMSDYPNVNDTAQVSAAQKEAFMADAVVVGVGSKPSGQTGKVNYGIPLSEIGGGGGDAESLAGHGLYASNDKLTVDTDDTLQIVEVGYLSETRYKVGVTNAVPPTTDASDGDVLTYDATSDDIVWSAPQGGGGGGLPDASKIIGERTGSGGDYALFVPYCNITRDSDGNVETVGEIKWLWADVLALPDGYKDIPQ